MRDIGGVITYAIREATGRKFHPAVLPACNGRKEWQRQRRGGMEGICSARPPAGGGAECFVAKGGARLKCGLELI
jgi:hypothetical protein